MDLTKAEIAGPCQILFGGVDMGHTLEGVDLTVERDFADVNVDKYGSTPIDKVLTGTRVMITFKMAQPTFRQWDMALPETSSYDGAGALDRVDLGADAGASLRALANQLVIHPLKNGGDTKDDVVIYKAASYENVPLPLKINEQKVIQVTMIGFVDETYSSGRRLGHIGVASVS